MSRTARQLRRALERHAAETGRPVEVYRSREPLRLVRLGDRVQVRAGELLTVVDDAGLELGTLRAAAAGVFDLDGDAGRVLEVSRRRQAVLAEATTPVEQLDAALRKLHDDAGTVAEA